MIFPRISLSSNYFISCFECFLQQISFISFHFVCLCIYNFLLLLLLLFFLTDYSLVSLACDWHNCFRRCCCCLLLLLSLLLFLHRLFVSCCCACFMYSYIHIICMYASTKNQLTSVDLVLNICLALFVVAPILSKYMHASVVAVVVVTLAVLLTFAVVVASSVAIWRC